MTYSIILFCVYNVYYILQCRAIAGFSLSLCGKRSRFIYTATLVGIIFYYLPFAADDDTCLGRNRPESSPPVYFPQTHTITPRRGIERNRVMVDFILEYHRYVFNKKKNRVMDGPQRYTVYLHGIWYRRRSFKI